MHVFRANKHTRFFFELAVRGEGHPECIQVIRGGFAVKGHGMLSGSAALQSDAEKGRDGMVQSWLHAIPIGSRVKGEVLYLAPTKTAFACFQNRCNSEQRSLIAVKDP